MPYQGKTCLVVMSGKRRISPTAVRPLPSAGESAYDVIAMQHGAKLTPFTFVTVSNLVFGTT